MGVACPPAGIPFNCPGRILIRLSSQAQKVKCHGRRIDDFIPANVSSSRREGVWGKFEGLPETARGMVQPTHAPTPPDDADRGGSASGAHAAVCGRHHRVGEGNRGERVGRPYAPYGGRSRLTAHRRGRATRWGSDRCVDRTPVRRNVDVCPLPERSFDRIYFQIPGMKSLIGVTGSGIIHLCRSTQPRTDRTAHPAPYPKDTK